MSNAKSSWSKWSPVSVAFLALAAFGLPALGQEAANTSAQGGSYVDDWSTHHLVFSNPGAREDAVKNGTLDRWTRITNDTRFRMQQGRRSMTRLGALPVAADEGLVTDQAGFGRLPGPRRPDPIELHRIGEGIDKDWSQALGTSAKAQLVIDIATPGSSSISGSSILTVDGTAFDASAPTGSTGVLTMGTAPTSGTLIVGGITYTFSGTTLGTTPAANNCNVY